MNTKLLLTGTLLTAALVTTSAFADDGVSDIFGQAYYNQTTDYNQTTESSEFVKVSVKADISADGGSDIIESEQ